MRPKIAEFQSRLKGLTLDHATTKDAAAKIRGVGLNGGYVYACVDEGWVSDEWPENVLFSADAVADRTYPDPEGQWGEHFSGYSMERLVEKFGSLDLVLDELETKGKKGRKMTIETLKELSKDEKLLVLTALEVEVETMTFSGHNTAWSETISLVLKGRKGLLDYTDEELDEELASNLELFDEANLGEKYALLDWVRKLSNIKSVSSEKRDWEPIPEEEQENFKG